MTPIGVLHSDVREKYEVPHQPSPNGHLARIELFPDQNFEQALMGLEGFSHVWVLFLFNQASHWKPMVLPPGLRKKVGVFATRSPHRPNRIGMSALPLLGVEKRGIVVGCSDLLDKTPILDIKPYITASDAVLSTAQGWVAQRGEQKPKMVSLSDTAQRKMIALHEKGHVLPLSTILERRTRRITGKWEKGFILAYKSFRLKIEDTETTYIVHSISEA